MSAFTLSTDEVTNQSTSLTTESDIDNAEWLFLNYDGNDTKNDIDRIVMTIYSLLILIPGTFLNGFVIYLTTKYHQFHTPYMYIKSSCAVLDILLAINLTPHIIINDYFGKGVSSRLMCYSSDFGIAVFYSTAQFTAVVALERYLYFCRPFVYQRWVTWKSIIATNVITFLCAQIYIFSTEIIYGRELQSLVALCQLQDQGFHSALQFGMFFVPTIIATIFSIHKIITLMNKVNADVSSLQGPQGAFSESTMRKRAARRGLRYSHLQYL